MTIQEASERYRIPMKILQMYESWGLCGAVKKVMGNWQYDDSDLEKLSLIMTLHDIGFQAEEIERYMRMELDGDSTRSKRLQMLNLKREEALYEIHFHEKQLEYLDYLRHNIQEI